MYNINWLEKFKVRGYQKLFYKLDMTVIKKRIDLIAKIVPDILLS